MPVKKQKDENLEREKVGKKSIKKIKNETAVEILKEPTNEISKDNDYVPQISDDMVLDEDYTLNDVYEDVDSLAEADFYDVNYDRDVFMELRKIIDNAFAKRNKSKEEEQKYDDIVYNLTTNCLDDKYLQDFMGYCYKKGKYDFCLMNFEKYMKWTILAASRGNAFSLSKLQLFLSNQVNELLSINRIDLIMDTLELDPEQFVMVLTKKLCDRLVFILDLFPEDMIKEQEVLLEQNDQSMRKFDKAKEQALEKVANECRELIDSINTLDDEIAKSKEIKREYDRMKNNAEQSVVEEDSKPNVLTNEQMEAEAARQANSSNRFTKREPSKKKFRW